VKITILGAGTDASNLPGIENRFPPGYFVELGTENILFECSEGVRFRLEQMGQDYTAIKHLAISHSHPDHYVLVPFYQSIHNNLNWSGRYDEPHLLNIYAPKNITREFWDMWRMHHPNFPEGLKTPKLNFITMPSECRVGDAKLSGFSVYHGKGLVPAVAYRLEAGGKVFAYSGDSGICDGVIEAARNADVFICETSAGIDDEKSGTVYGHLNPRQAGEVAKSAGAKQIVFVHYTGLDSDEAMIEDCKVSGFTGKVVVGKDFQVFEI